MEASLLQRRSGVLLHVTSLPGPFAHGVCGEEALRFIDRLADHGFRCWQFLPLGPVHGHGSPYESLSSFAANPELIDLRLLSQQGWLPEARLTEVLAGQCQPAMARREAIAHALAACLPVDSDLREAWLAYEQSQADWLRPYACFMAFRAASQGQPWWQWPADWKQGDASSFQLAETLYADDVRYYAFEQFVFARQWQRIRTHARQRGVALFGDLPIYVAHDSADVWCHQNLFTLDETGQCTHVAGVPPDYFSADGQRWGNPLYRWDVMQRDGFRWWRQRVAHQLQYMDWMRIDHFLGLYHYWAIPAQYQHGRVGEWIKAPGAALLAALQQDLGALPLIAEDLGLITEEVTALRQQFALPGMKVLQFAFGGEADNPFLPHNHELLSVVYTGTHDNNTSCGWFEELPPATQQHMKDYLACATDDMPWPLIRAALASVATLAILPMQDLLALPAPARFNTPGTLEGNWRWRMQTLPAATDRCWQLAAAMNALYGR